MSPLRILAIHPGASFATNDVYVGHVAAIRRMGHEVLESRLDYRIGVMGEALNRVWRKQRKLGGPLADQRPTSADIQFYSGLFMLHQYADWLPDWVLVFSAMYCHPNLIRDLTNVGARMALVFSESPYDDAPQARIAPFAEVCFTNERASVPVLRAANPNTHYLPHAYDPARHNPSLEVPEGTPAHDVCFVGTGFQERIDFLGAVDWTGIDLGLYGAWAALPSRHPLRKFLRSEEIDNHEAVALYRRAKIGINLFRSSKGFGVDAPRIAEGEAESLNPRLLELAACGVFTLSDYRAEVREVFGEAMPTFRTPQELGALIRGWLADDYERELMASTLPGLVKDWTFDAMAARLVAHLQEPAPVVVSPMATGAGHQLREEVPV